MWPFRPSLLDSREKERDRETTRFEREGEEQSGYSPIATRFDSKTERTKEGKEQLDLREREREREKETERRDRERKGKGQEEERKRKGERGKRARGLGDRLQQRARHGLEHLEAMRFPRS